MPAFTDNQLPSTGLMSSQPSTEPSAQPSAVEPPKPAAATKNYKVNPVGDKPVTRDVSDKELVSSNMNGLLNENSEYMKIAKREAFEAANERGMLNSSMAIGSAHEAAIKSAMPIAQQDAATHFQTQQNNQNTVNDFNKQEAANQNTLGQMRAQSAYQMAQDQAASNLRASEAAAASGLRVSEATALSDVQIKEKLQLLEAQSATDLKKQAASLDANYRNGYLQSATNIVSNAQQQIASIYSNTSINAVQQKAAVAKIQTDMNKNLEWLTKSADALKDWPIKTDSFTNVADDLAPPKPVTPNLPGSPGYSYPYYPYR